MSIQRDAMIVNLQVGQWVGQRLDKKASSKVTGDAGADDDAARVNKHLVPKEVLLPIQQAATAVRNHYYAKTLPWRDNGDRLLTRKMYMTFMTEHGPLVDKWRDAVRHFLETTYPQAVSRAEFRMGELFNLDDYPTPAALQPRFYINLDLDVVTDASDFRVQLEDDQLGEVRAQMESAMCERLNKAVSDVWGRLHVALKHFRDRMADGEAVFRDTTVTNLREIVEMLPALNVLDDPKLDELGVTISRELADYDPKDLRKNPTVREAVAKKATDILDVFESMKAAFAGVE